MGDILTTIDKKDLLTDIDAYILKHHSEFKDMDLDQAIEKYFHIKIGKSLFLITFGILVVSLLYLDLTHFLYTLLSCSILSYTLNKVKYLEIGSVLPQLEAKQTTETFEPLDPLEQLEH